MRDTNGERVSLNDAAGVASLVLGSERDAMAAEPVDHKDLRHLANYVRHAKDAVAAARPEAILIDQVPMAMAELVAVVAATEEATGVFLEAAEQLDILSEGLPREITAKLTAITTAIYEASGFQDIIGQRISKVQGFLKEIEDKVAKMTDAIGYQPDPDAPPSEPAPGAAPRAAMGPGSEPGDEDLLDGPALPGTGATQEDIDALFD